MAISLESEPVGSSERQSLLERHIPRRKFLSASVVSAAGLAAMTIPHPASTRNESFGNPDLNPTKPVITEGTLRAQSRIVEENQKKGDELNWSPSQGYKEVPFGLYVNQNSIAAGERLQIFASGKDTDVASLEVFRIGYYEGKGARRVLLQEDVKIPNQGWWLPETGLRDAPKAVYDKDTGLLDCNWEPVTAADTTGDWVSGYYLVRLTDKKKGVSSEMPIIVRDDQNPGKLLVLFSTFTPQAYSNFGGQSLYGYTTSPEKNRAFKVSLNRPLGKKYGSGQEILDNYDPQFVRWIEQNGYDITYCTDYDLHHRPDLLNESRGIVYVGHAEYWTAQMFDNALAARNSGKHAAFLGANDVYWQVRLEPDAMGKTDRTIVCYKSQSDPKIGNPRQATVRFNSPEVGRPQSALIGTVYGSELGGELGDLSPMNQDWITGEPKAGWILEGTGLRLGDRIPGLVGREYDTLGQSSYSPINLDVVAASPVKNAHGQKGTAHTTLHEMQLSGSLAFSAGTLRWNRALIPDTPFYDSRVNRITSNFLDRMIRERRQFTTNLTRGG